MSGKNPVLQLWPKMLSTNQIVACFGHFIKLSRGAFSYDFILILLLFKIFLVGEVIWSCSPFLFRLFIHSIIICVSSWVAKHWAGANFKVYPYYFKSVTARNYMGLYFIPGRIQKLYSAYMCVPRGRRSLTLTFIHMFTFMVWCTRV